MQIFQVHLNQWWTLKIAKVIFLQSRLFEKLWLINSHSSDKINETFSY